MLLLALIICNLLLTRGMSPSSDLETASHDNIHTLLTYICMHSKFVYIHIHFGDFLAFFPFDAIAYLSHSHLDRIVLPRLENRKRVQKNIP